MSTNAKRRAAAVGVVDGSAVVLWGLERENELTADGGEVRSRKELPPGTVLGSGRILCGRYVVCVLVDDYHHSARELWVYDSFDRDWVQRVALGSEAGDLGRQEGRPVLFVGGADSAGGELVLRVDLDERSATPVPISLAYADSLFARSSDGKVAGATDRLVWRLDDGECVPLDDEEVPADVGVGAWLDERRIVVGGMGRSLWIYEADRRGPPQVISLGDVGELDQLIVLEPGRAVAVRDYHRVVRVWVEDGRLDVFEGAQAMGAGRETGLLWIADAQGVCPA